MVQLIINQNWFRQWLGTEKTLSHYLSQGWSRPMVHIWVSRIDWVDYFTVLGKYIHAEKKCTVWAHEGCFHPRIWKWAIPTGSAVADCHPLPPPNPTPPPTPTPTQPPPPPHPNPTPVLKIRRSHDRLIFDMGISIPGKDGLYIETGSWYLSLLWYPFLTFTWSAMLWEADGLAFNGANQYIYHGYPTPKPRFNSKPVFYVCVSFCVLLFFRYKDFHYNKK